MSEERNPDAHSSPIGAIVKTTLDKLATQRLQIQQPGIDTRAPSFPLTLYRWTTDLYKYEYPQTRPSHQRPPIYNKDNQTNTRNLSLLAAPEQERETETETPQISTILYLASWQGKARRGRAGQGNSKKTTARVIDELPPAGLDLLDRIQIRIH